MTTLQSLEPALSYLQTAGYAEETLLAHSPAWIGDRVAEIQQRRDEEFRLSTARDLQVAFLASAAAFGSRDHHEAMSDWIGQLTATAEQEDHFLNPDAETDWEGLRKAGFKVTSPEEEANA